MREAFVYVQEMASKLTSAIGANKKMAEQVEKSTENATLLINQAFERLLQVIEERKKILFSEMEAISLSKTAALTLQKEELMKMLWTVKRKDLPKVPSVNGGFTASASNCPTKGN